MRVFGLTLVGALWFVAPLLHAQVVPDRWCSDRGLVLHAKPRAGDDVLYEGTFEVAENPALQGGRTLSLRVLVVPARGKEVRDDPIFYLAGGPGQAATETVGMFLDSWMREERDIVLVDQRGTGKSNPLRVAVDTARGAENQELAWIFDPERFRSALPVLQEQADLRYYTTPIAMDDLDAVRNALGFEQINLIGSSYGTRAALVYMRQYPQRVRAAVLDGVAPIAFKNPLYHARSAQESFDLLAKECAANPDTKKCYPDLKRTLAEVLDRFANGAIMVELPATNSSTPQRIALSRVAFCDALRFLLYYSKGNREVPALLLKARDGDFRAIATLALQQQTALTGSLALGMLMCVTAAEDLPRIREEEIESACARTFLGEARVRDQLAIASFWPRGAVPLSYAEPVAVDVPTLLLSGTHDAVTPPHWGAEAASHLPHSKHVIVEGCHGVASHPRIAQLVRKFLEHGSVKKLDLRGLDEVRLPGILLPDGKRARVMRR